MCTNGYYLITAAALSVDAFAVGIAFGVKNIRFSRKGALIFALTCVIWLAVSAFCGRLMLALSFGRQLGGLILLLAGVVMIFQQAGVIKEIPLIGLLASPEKSDINRDSKIDGIEAVFIAAALSIDGCIVSAGNAAENGGALLPVSIFVFHCLFLKAGTLTGGKFAADGCEKVCGIVAGLLLFSLGLDGVFY